MRAVGGAGLHAVIRLDERQHVFKQIALEHLRVVRHRRRTAGDDGVAVHHHHHHRLGAALGDEIVENPVRFAVRRPRGLVVAGAVLEIERRILRARFLVVARRRVDGQLAQAPERFGVIRVLAHHAVRHVLEIVQRGGWLGRCRMLVRGSRIGLMAGLTGSIMVSPSTWKLYSQTPGSIGPTVTLHTSLESLVIDARPLGHCPLTTTSVALGACRRNVTLRSACTSGERTGGGRRGRHGGVGGGGCGTRRFGAESRAGAEQDDERKNEGGFHCAGLFVSEIEVAINCRNAPGAKRGTSRLCRAR